MFKENENSGTKTEEANGQQVNQESKLKPFGHLSSTSAKPMSTDGNNIENPENSLTRENSKEENTMFQENQNSSIETEAKNDQLENQINGNDPVGVITCAPDEPTDDKRTGADQLENYPVRQNSVEDVTLNERIVNDGKEASADVPASSDHPLGAGDSAAVNPENCTTRQNSTTEPTEKEKMLYDNIKRIRNNFIRDTKKHIVKMRHQIGIEISNFYKGKYGENEMNKISKNTGICTSTLYKATQFAKKFTKDDLKRLLEKDFISFRLVGDFLSMEKDQVFQIIESSSNAKEAQQKINEIKRGESAKNTTSDDGADSTVPDKDNAPDKGVGANTVPEETDKDTQPADQVSAQTEPQSPDNQAKVAQKEGSQDGQGVSGSEQPATDKKSAKKKQQDTEADNNKEVSKPDFFGQEGTPDSFSYLFETMKTIGTRLVDASTEKPANVELRKIIKDSIMDLSNLLTLVPEATCAHSGVTLSGGTEWESSCQSAALPV